MKNRIIMSAKIRHPLLQAEIFLALCLLSFLPPKAHAQEYIVAVMPFRDATHYRWYDQKLTNYAEWLDEAVPAVLVKSKIITIVHRSQIKKAFRELRLGQSGYIDDAMAVRVGKWVGANTAVMGSIIKLGEEFRIDAYAIIVETGEMIDAIPHIICTREELLEIPEVIAHGLLSFLSRDGMLFDKTVSLALQEEENSVFPVCTVTDVNQRFRIRGELIETNRGGLSRTTIFPSAGSR